MFNRPVQKLFFGGDNVNGFDKQHDLVAFLQLQSLNGIRRQLRSRCGRPFQRIAALA